MSRLLGLLCVGLWMLGSCYGLHDEVEATYVSDGTTASTTTFTDNRVLLSAFAYRHSGGLHHYFNLGSELEAAVIRTANTEFAESNYHKVRALLQKARDDDNDACAGIMEYGEFFRRLKADIEMKSREAKYSLHRLRTPEMTTKVNYLISRDETELHAIRLALDEITTIFNSRKRVTCKGPAQFADQVKLAYVAVHQYVVRMVASLKSIFELTVVYQRNGETAGSASFNNPTIAGTFHYLKAMKKESEFDLTGTTLDDATTAVANFDSEEKEADIPILLQAAQNKSDTACRALFQYSRVLARMREPINAELDSASSQNRRVNDDTLRKMNVLTGKDGLDNKGVSAALEEVIEIYEKRQFIICQGNALYESVVKWAYGEILRESMRLLRFMKEDLDKEILKFDTN